MITKPQNVLSFHIIERKGANNLITWNYPTISDSVRNFLQAKCFSCAKRQNCFYVLSKNDVKAYVRQCEHEEKRFAVVLLGEEFEYDKFRLLSDVLAKHYTKNFNPVDLVKVYLKLFTTGSVDVQENGSQKTVYDFRNFKEETRIKDLIRRFELEIIFLYSAILLKRRILVYHDDIEKMQKELHTICCFISTRNMKKHFCPFVENASELRGLSCYLAGTTNGKLLINENLYDIYVNFSTDDIVISPEAKDTFVVSKTQKEIAHQLVKLVEEERSENEIKKFVDERTEELLDQLKSLSTIITNVGQKMLTIDELKSKNFKPALENFLFNLAVAEDRIIL